MRKATNLFGLVALVAVIGAEAKAQCSLEAFPSDTIRITCGESRDIQLSAFGISGNFAINNNFNNNTLGTGWDGTPAVTFSNPCLPSPDGTTYVWMGAATPQPRILTTQAFDLSTGGTVCYEMRYAVQSEPAPCEGPDEPQEGVYLQYSINNGVNWVTFDYLDPIGGYDPTITSWQQYCHAIPVAAQTANTKIRWFQDATSGAEYDHWGLDNVFISINDPNYDYVWAHNGQTGAQPDIVTISSDSVFSVIYTDGTDTCFAEVVVVALPPVFTISAVSDTTICGLPGCIELNAVADILVRPASAPTFLNNEFQPLAPLGQPTIIPVAVGGVPIPTVDTGTVASICINVNNPSLPFPFPVNFATLSIVLECPEGQTVTLVSQGSISGTTIVNMCFSDDGAPLSSGTPPFSGTFRPVSGSFDNLIGCSTNGVWRMTITNSAAFAFGFFNSWDISFDVPEIRYTGIYEWSPTTGLSDPLSLNPTACPQSSTVTYELMVADSFNCASATHSVTIDVKGPQIDTVIAVAPFPDLVNGELTIVASGGEAPLEYSLDGVVYQQSGYFTSLDTGLYALMVQDADGCMDSVSYKLEENGVLVPNIFGPGTRETDNQTFVIKGMIGPEVQIFSRWGRKVYESTAYQNDWDGEKCTEGVYFYTIKNKLDGQAYTGYVHLMR